MDQETRRCARPDCVFSPLPQMTETGSLGVSDFCSDACREWLVNAVATAQNDDPNAVDDVERQTRRLLLISELLNLRDHPSEMTFLAAPTAPLEEVTHA
ncbi:hypothetical protein ACFY7A_35650 [Streptomyces longwoodensis]|uniref:hypothetical protein n=1 Tax=Streptomyces longwoodensis TaxID=68231 RepID=UPI0036ADFF35